jgi:phosphatidylglycerophosphatase GEP4
VILSLISNRNLFIPKMVVKDFSDLKFQELYAMGIRGIAFDKDNTLTKPYALQIHEPFRENWNELTKVFRNNIVIVSNSAGSSDDYGFKEAKEIEDIFKVKVLYHGKKKPLGGEKLTQHFHNLKANEIAIVGDRITTDMLYGNLNGFFSILCSNIITEEGDNKMAVIFRKLEKLMLRNALKR